MDFWNTYVRPLIVLERPTPMTGLDLYPSTPDQSILLFQVNANPHHPLTLHALMNTQTHTATLQTPYLLTLALTTSIALPSFPFTPPSTFHLLQKLDCAFASLLRGVNVETGQALPGFTAAAGIGADRKVGKVSVTEKVRIRGVVERTRVGVVEVAGGDGGGTEMEGGRGRGDWEGEMTTGGEDEEEEDEEDMRVEGHHGRWEMEIARVYERTVMELGLALDVGTPRSGGFGR